MAGRVEISDGWEAPIQAGMAKLFEEKLGPDIAEDARRYAPERTGALRDSIEHHLEDGKLIVSATGGDGGRDYAAYVELGHRVFHPSTGQTGPEVVEPEPFLRPALYKERGDR
ncbi:MAG: hypothetical protein JWO67_6718 [Streptosporangiaceae bacterium]|nr:hypothetical protein [Streptosporangiaceae bacterium]